MGYVLTSYAVGGPLNGVKITANESWSGVMAASNEGIYIWDNAIGWTWMTTPPRFSSSRRPPKY